MKVGVFWGRRPGSQFDMGKYCLENNTGNTIEAPVLNFLRHELGIEIHDASSAHSLRTRNGKDNHLFGYIDFPVHEDFVGHDYIRVIGWCYLQGEDIESAHAEVIGSQKKTPLRIGIFRPDIAPIYPQLKSFNIGFQGDVYPYMRENSNLELRITARTVTGFTHTMHRSLKVDPAIKEPPANKNFIQSEVAQLINDLEVFSR